jgi:hypothetical protein
VVREPLQCGHAVQYLKKQLSLRYLKYHTKVAFFAFWIFEAGMLLEIRDIRCVLIHFPIFLLYINYILKLNNMRLL